MARFKPMLLLLVMLTAVLFVAACGDDEDVAASVNGENIYQEELDEQIEQTLQMLGMPTEGEESEEVIEMIQTSLLDQMILQKLILQDGENNQIQASEEEVDLEFENIKASVPEDTTFEEVLEAQDYTEESLREEIENQIVFNKVLTLEHLDEEIEVSEEEIENYYDQLVEEFGEEMNDLESEEDEIKSTIQQEKYLENLQSNADVEILIEEA